MPRLFVAARLPECLLPSLLEAQHSLRQQARHIRLTDPKNLHLTLRFLGEMEEGQAGMIRDWFAGLVLPPAADLQVSIQRYGAFPGDKGALLWAGLACGPGVYHLVQQMDKGLESVGFLPDSKPFLPHVTLARKVGLSKPLHEVLEMLPVCKTASSIPGISLYQSILNPRGPEYRPLLSLDTQPSF